MNVQPGWTDDRVALLKKLWPEGYSAAQIAQQLGGGVSRCAVIGKARRLGISDEARKMPAKPIYRGPAPPKALKQTEPKAAAPPKPGHIYINQGAVRVGAPSRDLPPERDEAPGTCTLLTLGAGMCKFPIGDPRNADFSFCGARQESGGPYCGHHSRISRVAETLGKKRSAAELARGLRRYI